MSSFFTLSRGCKVIIPTYIISNSIKKIIISSFQNQLKWQIHLIEKSFLNVLKFSVYKRMYLFFQLKKNKKK